MSLSTKMRTFRRTLARKQKTVFTDDQCKLISRHMPRDFEALRTKCEFTESQISSYGNHLLLIIATHDRDQEKFEECFREIQAFARGGRYGMHLLNAVYPRIISHFGMESDKYDVFDAAGVWEDAETGKLKARGTKEEL
jgi:hypothetical protein